jgi:exopolyphosphatase/guanosine-5'-triphosphate,3'-diphosphate pyrophosphatase
MRRLAAIDIGTNTVRLLVADVGPGAAKIDVLRRSTITRLGEGVDQAGAFRADAISRTLEALGAYSDEMRSLRVESVKAIATSAARDADNSSDFTAAAANILGCPVDIVSGETEASYAFLGATFTFPFARPDEPVVVFDVGGGSTEIIAGCGPILKKAISVNIGSVRLTEQFVRHDPPDEAEIAAIRDQAASDIERGMRAVVAGGEPVRLIGVAGTITTIKAVELGLIEYDARRIHLSELTLDAVRHTFDRFIAVSLSERAAMPGLEPKRADVIPAGALITEAVMQAAGVDRLTVSESDIIDGTLLALANMTNGNLPGEH